MKILLMTLNSKYIHSNLAVHSLYRYYHTHYQEQPAEIICREYTINHQMDDVLIDMVRGEYDVIFASCYIWNIEHMIPLMENLVQLRPETLIFFGGPEVTFAPEKYLNQYSFIKGVLVGEGERIFANTVQKLLAEPEGLSEVKGLATRDALGRLRYAKEALISPLDEIPFVYETFEPFENRIIYYESTRGCPFQCSYCLSSACGPVRYLSLERVYTDLAFFLDHKIPQVKFIDRTFNVKKTHALPILEFIKNHDNGITNFHFEVTASLLDEAYFEVLKGMREGLVQFELGIQTTREETLHAIQRHVNQNVLFENIQRLIALKNAHIHVDLIAGLPFDTFESFLRAFDDVYNLGADQFQLGFLKMLEGTLIASQKTLYGYKVRKQAPYEVLENQWLSFEEMSILKELEQLVELYYNSGRFKYSLAFLMKHQNQTEAPSRFYLDLRAFFDEKGYFKQPLGTAMAFDVLLTYAKAKGHDTELFAEILKFDYYRSNLKGSRSFFEFPELPQFNVKRLRYLSDERSVLANREGYIGKAAKEILKTVQFIVFKYDIMTLMASDFEAIDRSIHIVLFDYAMPLGTLEKSKVYDADDVMECE